MQRLDLAAYAQARGWAVVKIYEDKATGTNDKRPQLQQLMSDARARKFDILLIWKLDRLFRSMKGMVTAIQEFEDVGVQFISFKDQIDLTTASGRLMVHLISAFAEFEASLIRERVTAGVRAKIAKTGRWGPGRTRDDAVILNLREQGLSVRQIAVRLGLSATSIMRSLKSVPGTLKKSV